MASPNATFTEMVTTTLREHRKSLADNVSNHNAVLNRLNKRGNKRVVDGGYEIIEPLDYAENSTYQRYSGYDTLNVSASDVLSAAKYDWKQSAVHVTASGLELRQNSGKSQLINLAKSRLKNAMRTFANNMATDVYSDGTASNQINGLQALISADGTGTVGGINSASPHTWWKSVTQAADDPIQGGGAITVSADTFQSLMLPLWLRLTRGTDSPDLITMDETYFTFYENSLTDLKRYADEDSATGGFVSLKYKTADVIFDSSGGTWSSGHPSSTAYFINTDYLKIVAHRDADMTEVPEQRAVNQDAVVIPIISQCNLTLSNRSLQGTINASA